MIFGKPDKKQFRAGVHWLVWSGVLALVSTGSWLFYILDRSQPPKPVAASVIAVERGSVENTINESGTVELGEQQTLKAPSETAVDQVLVKPGDRVKAGQILLTLRNPDRDTALAAEQLKIQGKELDRARSQQKIIETQEQLVLEQQKLQTLKPLVAQGAIPQQKLQEQQTQTRQAQAALRDAQTESSKAALDLQSLQLERQKIQRQLQDTAIAAPVEGTVLDVKVKSGEGIQFRTELLTLGDPAQELVKLQLSTLNAALVRVNQLSRVSVIGPNAKIFTGQVKSLYPMAVTPDNSQGQSSNSSNNQSSQATVPAIVKLNTPTHTLIPGAQVNVEIVLNSRQNVLTINPEAIQRSEAQPFVWIRDSEGKAQKRAIAIGLEGLLNVEVTSGLSPGEQVILPPSDTPLKTGTPVIPVKKPLPKKVGKLGDGEMVS